MTMATLCKRKTVPQHSATKTKSPSLPVRRPRPFFSDQLLSCPHPWTKTLTRTCGFLTSGFLTSGFLSVGLELQATFCARVAVSSSSSARLPACFNSLVSPSLLCVMAGWGTRAEWKSLWLSLQFQLVLIYMLFAPAPALGYTLTPALAPAVAPTLPLPYFIFSNAAGWRTPQREAESASIHKRTEPQPPRFRYSGRLCASATLHDDEFVCL